MRNMFLLTNFESKNIVLYSTVPETSAMLSPLNLKTITFRFASDSIHFQQLNEGRKDAGEDIQPYSEVAV